LVEGADWPWPVRHYSTSCSLPVSSVENGYVFVYCAGEKRNISEAIESINQRTLRTEYGETSEFLHSGERWALPAPFMNCISGFILLYYYKVKLRLRFKMNIRYMQYRCHFEKKKKNFWYIACFYFLAWGMEKLLEFFLLLCNISLKYFLLLFFPFHNLYLALLSPSSNKSLLTLAVDFNWISTFLLEKLIVIQLLKKFADVHGILPFIFVFKNLAGPYIILSFTFKGTKLFGLFSLSD
jgi:hypothetical protein